MFERWRVSSVEVEATAGSSDPEFSSWPWLCCGIDFVAPGMGKEEGFVDGWCGEVVQSALWAGARASMAL